MSAGSARRAAAASAGEGGGDRARRAGAHTAPGHPEDALGDPETVARAICLRLLTAQPRTRAELAAALRQRGVPADAADRVLARFADVGLIDDRAFADAWVGSRHAGRGLARRALADELRRRGVAPPTVEAAVAGLDPGTEEQTARALVRRRLPSTARLDPAARFRRLLGLLARKGYPAGLATRVVREEVARAGLPGGPDLADDNVDGVEDAAYADIDEQDPLTSTRRRDGSGRRL